MRHQVIDDAVDEFIPAKTYADQWDAAGLHAAGRSEISTLDVADRWMEEDGVDDEEIRERLCKASTK